jgi:hypothetical protein
LRYIENTANIIGAALRSALIGEAVRVRRAFRQSGALSQRQYEDFHGFFIFAALRLLAEYESQRQ